MFKFVKCHKWFICTWHIPVEFWCLPNPFHWHVYWLYFTVLPCWSAFIVILLQLHNWIFLGRLMINSSSTHTAAVDQRYASILIVGWHKTMLLYRLCCRWLWIGPYGFTQMSCRFVYGFWCLSAWFLWFCTMQIPFPIYCIYQKWCSQWQLPK